MKIASRKAPFLAWGLAALLTTGSARAAEPVAPAAALSAMPKGAISLQNKTFAVPSGQVLVHLYTLPAGHSPAVEAISGEKRSGPVKREHITPGPSLKPSRFWLDVFSKSGTQLKRFNSVPFIASEDAHGIELRWLKPARKQGPIVLLDFGYMHWYQHVAIVFPQDFSGSYTVQEFGYGGEGDIGVSQRFDKTDKTGTLLVEEEETTDTGSKTYLYPWDGVEFFDKSTPYFVIGASLKTRAEAEVFVAQHKLGFVRPSSHYTKLAPSLWIVIFSRHASPKEAAEMVKSLRSDNKIAAYVKRAF